MCLYCKYGNTMFEFRFLAKIHGEVYICFTKFSLFVGITIFLVHTCHNIYSYSVKECGREHCKKFSWSCANEPRKRIYIKRANEYCYGVFIDPFNSICFILSFNLQATISVRKGAIIEIEHEFWKNQKQVFWIEHFPRPKKRWEKTLM